MAKRHVSLPADAADGVDVFIDEVDERLSSDEDTCAVVADVLVDLFGDREAYEAWQGGAAVSPAERVRLQGYDPCNATLESEYYAEKDEEAFERSKHLQWLWRQFDATPMADNIEFALQFRQMLATHLFAEAGDRVSISDGAHIYSHDHDLVDQTEVRNFRTVIEDDARVTYDAMVRAGCRVGRNSVVGARAVVQSDIPAHHVVVGMPARSVKIKPGFEDEAVPLDEANERRVDEREVPYSLPDDLDQLDEFSRETGGPAEPHQRG